MSALWIGLGAYLGALVVALVWTVALGRAAKLADEIETLRRASRRRSPALHLAEGPALRGLHLAEGPALRGLHPADATALPQRPPRARVRPLIHEEV